MHARHFRFRRHDENMKEGVICMLKESKIMYIIQWTCMGNNSRGRGRGRGCGRDVDLGLECVV